MIELRLPNIKGSDKEQLVQIRSYLYQLADQLQFALNNISPTSVNVTQQQKAKASSTPQQALDAEVTFDKLKPFIIKSADIVNAYYDEVSKRLEGLYVAQSDFGTYTENTAQDISENSTSITRAFTNIQIVSSNIGTISDEVGTLDSDIQGVKQGVDSNIKVITNEVGALDSKIDNAKETINTNIQGIKSDLDTLNRSIIEVNSNTRSGLLYFDENGIPIYGFEIGQKNFIDGVETFNKYARFTSDRLSFYDSNDSEVAYISDYKLYIRNVEITSTYKIGGFQDVVMANGDVVTKWAGGSV